MRGASTLRQVEIKKQKERRASLEVFVVPFDKASLALEIGVRQWRVAWVTCWFELSLLCGFLGAALLRGFLGAALFSCGLLSTFLSCHSFYVLLFLSFVFLPMTTRCCVQVCLVG